MKKYLPILRESDFFAAMSDDEILKALDCINAHPTKATRDQYVLRAGDSTENMGLLLSGSALIVQEDLWGHRNIMTKIAPGGFFAEPFAILPDVALNISVVANEDCHILFLNLKKMLTVCPSACQHHNKLIQNLVAVLSKKILLFNDKITHMSKRTTGDKIMSYLSSESVRQCSLEFDIPFNRQQLADYLCVDRAAMSVEISKLQKAGLLESHRNHFKLFTENHI
ncbi:MAG: Crp/Fnr family transcriptional regulator [Eubacteriaceae bacterium]|nr:Crp/Fnr family transcriptional regulator [Eubacteriaceae bacterium]